MIIMQKASFKKILQLLDEIEHQECHLEEAFPLIEQAMNQNHFPIQKNDMIQIIQLLLRYQCIKTFELGFDLSPVATVFARSSLHSNIEAIACFEMFLNKQTIKRYQLLLKDESFYPKQQFIKILGNDLFAIQQHTSLIDIKHDTYRFSISLRDILNNIIEEYQQRTCFYISSILLARFATSIVPNANTVEYRNENRSIVAYPYLNDILALIPKRGIPSNRDVTKALQTFYKDTLFHEFNHQCPICKLHIPHMLIASHIKPFRDCAHIYEPIDHNNGLLLCRNHDYLFDQGYFSFDENGYLLMSDELKKHKPFSAVHITKNYMLPKRYLSNERKAFLAYHRQHILKK